MNCVELQQSLAEVEDGNTREQQAHLRSCAACANLLQELKLIVATAGDLQDLAEPSPRVWNSIEIALRQEGLVRPQRLPANRITPSFIAGLGWSRWLLPAAAMLLLTTGIYQWRVTTASRPLNEVATVMPPSGSAGLDDQDFLEEVADNSPALRNAYEDNLRQVNASINDAQNVVNENPNDAEARRALMDAYQQKSMLFEMAMDHAQP
jgi:hypothetical protein